MPSPAKRELLGVAASDGVRSPSPAVEVISRRTPTNFYYSLFEAQNQFHQQLASFGRAASPKGEPGERAIGGKTRRLWFGKPEVKLPWRTSDPPPLPVYPCVASRGRLSEEQAAARAEIKALPDVVASTTRDSVVLQRLAARKRFKHQEALQAMQQELHDVALEIQSMVEEVSRDSLALTQQDSQAPETQAASPPREDSLLVTWSWSGLQEAKETLCSLHESRQKSLKTLAAILDQIENLRTESIKKILRQYYRTFSDISYLSVDDVKRLMDEQVVALNSSLLVNKRTIADLIYGLQIQQFEQDQRRRQEWDEACQQWKTLQFDEYRRRLSEVVEEVRNPPARRELFQTMVARVAGINARRLKLLEALSALAPSTTSKMAVQGAVSDLEALHKEAGACVQGFLSRLHTAMQQAVRDTLTQMKTFSQQAVEDKQVTKDEAESVLVSTARAQLFPLRQEFEKQLEWLEQTFNQRNLELSQQQKIFIKYVQGCSHLWELHTVSLQCCERELRERLDEVNREFKAEDQTRESMFAALAVKGRQENILKALDGDLAMATDALEAILKNYEHYRDDQLMILPHYLKFVSQEVDRYDCALRNYFLVDRIRPLTPETSEQSRVETRQSVCTLSRSTVSVLPETKPSKRKLKQAAPPEKEIYHYSVVDEIQTDRGTKYYVLKREIPPPPVLDIACLGDELMLPESRKAASSSRLRRSIKTPLSPSPSRSLSVARVSKTPRSPSMSRSPSGSRLKRNPSSSQTPQPGSTQTPQAGSSTTPQADSTQNPELSIHLLGETDDSWGSGPGSGTDLSQPKEAKFAPPEEWTDWTKCLDVPEDRAVAVKDKIRLNFLNHLDSWPSLATAEAQAFLRMRVDEVMCAHDSRMHVFQTRQTNLERDVIEVRRKELMLHERRLTEHKNAMETAMAEMVERRDQLRKQHKATVTTFKKTLDKMGVIMKMSKTKHDILLLEHQVNALTDKTMEDIRKQTVAFVNFFNTYLVKMRRSNKLYYDFMKLFQDGGNFSSAERAACGQVLEAQTSKLDSLEQQARNEIATVEIKCLEELTRIAFVWEDNTQQALQQMTLTLAINNAKTEMKRLLYIDQVESQVQGQSMEKHLKTLEECVEAKTVLGLSVFLRHIFLEFKQRCDYLSCVPHRNSVASDRAGTSEAMASSRASSSAGRSGKSSSRRRASTSAPVTASKTAASKAGHGRRGSSSQSTLASSSVSLNESVSRGVALFLGNASVDFAYIRDNVTFKPEIRKLNLPDLSLSTAPPPASLDPEGSRENVIRKPASPKTSTRGSLKPPTAASGTDNLDFVNPYPKNSYLGKVSTSIRKVFGAVMYRMKAHYATEQPTEAHHSSAHKAEKPLGEEYNKNIGELEKWFMGVYEDAHRMQQDDVSTLVTQLQRLETISSEVPVFHLRHLFHRHGKMLTKAVAAMDKQFIERYEALSKKWAQNLQDFQKSGKTDAGKKDNAQSKKKPGDAKTQGKGDKKKQKLGKPRTAFAAMEMAMEKIRRDMRDEMGAFLSELGPALAEAYLQCNHSLLAALEKRAQDSILLYDTMPVDDMVEQVREDRFTLCSLNRRFRQNKPLTNAEGLALKKQQRAGRRWHRFTIEDLGRIPNSKDMDKRRSSASHTVEFLSNYSKDQHPATLTGPSGSAKVGETLLGTDLKPHHQLLPESASTETMAEGSSIRLLVSPEPGEGDDPSEKGTGGNRTSSFISSFNVHSTTRLGSFHTICISTDGLSYESMLTTKCHQVLFDTIEKELRLYRIEFEKVGERAARYGLMSNVAASRFCQYWGKRTMTLSELFE